jgi:3D-(3,5/4)-trihydroxycyclohexane-1,2-dione acylhydrolase (decyclizing)
MCGSSSIGTNARAHRGMETIELTVAAGVVQFLKAQFVARDGVEHRLVNVGFGIFGHGNVSGLGQALREYGGR